MLLTTIESITDDTFMSVYMELLTKDKYKKNQNSTDCTPVHKNNKFYITLIGNIRVKSKKKNYELFKVKKISVY